MWDTEVDLVCVGAGIGGLATAIATVDAGGDVIVADTSPDVGSVTFLPSPPVGVSVRCAAGCSTMAGHRDGRLPRGCRRGSRSAGATPRYRSRADSACERVDERTTGTVEPFVGSTMRAWDAKCLASPYGMLYSAISGRPTTKMRSDGEPIEVLPVGDIDRSVDVSQLDLADWMVAQACERDIEVLSASPLQRIVFEDGLIVGVVFDTPDGPFAVRARHGVTLSQRDYQPALVDRLIDAVPGDRKQVCLVGRSASRFGRVELVTITAAPAVDRAGVRDARASAPRPPARNLPSGSVRCLALRKSGWVPALSQVAPPSRAPLSGCDNRKPCARWQPWCSNVIAAASVSTPSATN